MLQILFLGFLPARLSACRIIRRPADELILTDEEGYHEDDDTDFFTSHLTTGELSGFWWSWWAFWGIPKVRYTTHTIALFAYVLLLSLLVGFPLGWLSATGELAESMLDVRQPGTDHLTGVIEVTIWVITLARVMDSAAAIMRARQRTVDFPLGQLKAYFSDSIWNRIDLVYNLLMLTCLVLRLASASIPSGSSQRAQARLLGASRLPHAFHCSLACFTQTQTAP